MYSVMWLIPFSILFVAIGLFVLLWAIDSGQYDDMEGAAERILFDDDASNDVTHDKHNAKNM